MKSLIYTYYYIILKFALIGSLKIGCHFPIFSKSCGRKYFYHKSKRNFHRKLKFVNPDESRISFSSFFRNYHKVQQFWNCHNSVFSGFRTAHIRQNFLLIFIQYFLRRLDAIIPNFCKGRFYGFVLSICKTLGFK